jgi:DamX protein
MENSKQTDPRRTLGQLIATLDKRLSALEARLVEPASDLPVQEASGTSAGTASERPGSASARLDSLAAGLAAQADKMRDVETGLVGRIADVDDDRRRTAAAIQRALDTHQEEVEARLRRRAGWTAALVVLALLLVPAAFWLGLRQAAGGSTDLSAELAQIRQEVARLSALNGADDPLGQRLAGLTETVSDISDSLLRIGADQEKGMEAAFERERSERQAADTGLAERLGRLEALQTELRGAMAALRSDTAETKASAAAAQRLGLTVATAPAADADGASIAGGPQPAAAGREDPAAGLTSQAETAGAGEREAPAAGAGGTDAGVAVAMGAGADAEASVVAGQTEAAAESEPSELPVTPQSAGEGSAGDTVVIGERRHALQLIGFFSFDELRRFSSRDDLPEQLYYREESLRGRPWYVLIHSLHSDYAAAEEERSRLSSELASLDVWIRPLPEGSRLERLEPEGEAVAN